MYAAYDALMGIEVYHAMKEQGALEVKAAEHMRLAAPSYWHISSTRPVHRTHIRNLWLGSNESSHLLRLAGEHLVREDRRWFHFLEGSGLSKSGKSDHDAAGKELNENIIIENITDPLSWSKATRHVIPLRRHA